ncbi:MAG TPA: T9SS type A sorting domain-containing protein [Flavobacterium sp.]|nr:T9SS type A sorting domain-containing protein [Flavobacterium sp.]
MKKLYTLLSAVIFLNSFDVEAQLFVSDSYVYVGNQFVYVKQNIELETDGNILLRREGQLLQGTTAASTNVGEGKLSAYQEGTSDNFAFNYWCSPVGNASNSIGNESFGITMLEQPISVEDSNPALMLSMSATNSISSPLSIAPRWIYKFTPIINNAQIYADWISVGSTSTIGAGQGFTMKGTGYGALDGYTPTGESAPNNPGGAQRYDYRGKPNDGNITIDVADDKFTLTGNPYPSAIDLSDFLTDNLNCTGIAYFWEHDKNANSHIIYQYRGGYGIYSPVSRGGTGMYIPPAYSAYDISGNSTGVTGAPPSPLGPSSRYFSPVGQGFMIEGNGAGSTVLMTNDYRVFTKENLSTSVFERNAENSEDDENEFLPYTPSVSGFDYTTVKKGEVPHIKINTLINGQGIKQIVVAFDGEATDGMDHAKDAKNPNGTAIDVNFVVETNNCVLSVIQFDESKRLPLSIKSNANATFTMKAVDFVNFNQAENVYLFDAETNLYHDIKNNQYDFVLPQGEFNNRYEITFRNSTLSIDDNVKLDIGIFQNNTIKSLVISNPNLIDLKSVSLYDLTGKRIFEKKNLGSQEKHEFSTSSIAEAVYLVELITSDNKKLTQKIIVSQSKN